MPPATTPGIACAKKRRTSGVARAEIRRGRTSWRIIRAAPTRMSWARPASTTATERAAPAKNDALPPIRMTNATAATKTRLKTTSANAAAPTRPSALRTDAADLRTREVEGRFFVALPDPVQQLVAGSEAAREGGICERAVGAGEKLGRRLRPNGQGIEKASLQFVQLVEHQDSVAARAAMTALRTQQPPRLSSRTARARNAMRRALFLHQRRSQIGLTT